MRKIIGMFLIFATANVFALEIDEKLTLRIVNTSETKKTVLINRGIEDGLAKNDHAKFYISTGVVARGVCIKLSPTRSVWSIYRLVNADFIRNDQVMKLKITPAVKITKDESRMLVEDDTSSSTVKDPRDLGIPLAEGANDLTFEQNARVARDTKLEDEIVSLLPMNREVFGLFQYGAMSEKVSPDNNLDDYVKDVNNLLLRVGGELYFKEEEKWYTRLSFAFTFTLERKSIQSYQGANIEETNNEFGFGVNIFPFTRPSKTHEIIHYFNYTFSLGTSSSAYQTGSEASVGSDASDVVDGSVLANSFGYGMRYYTRRGYGARIELSYYLRGDEFAADSANTNWIRTTIGPRVLMGISKRF